MGDDEGDEFFGVAFEPGPVAFGVAGGDNWVAVGVLDFFVDVEVCVFGVGGLYHVMEGFDYHFCSWLAVNCVAFFDFEVDYSCVVGEDAAFFHAVE